MSGMVEKIKAKVDDVLHKDGTNHHNTAGTTTTGTHTGNHGHHGHHAGAVDSNYPNTTSAGPNSGFNNTSTNAGPHDSNLANKLDPRVDSDMDGSRNFGAAQTGPGGVQNSAYGNQGGLTGNQGGLTGNQGGLTGNQGGLTGNQAGLSGNNNYGSTNAGPHNSNLANKLDPRVDSDRDGSSNLGAAQVGPGGTANYGNQGALGGNNTYGNQGALGSTTGAYGAQGSTNHGPHSSNLANALDPRVDSDRDGSRNAGMATTGPGATYNASTGPANSTAGPHGSNLLNKLDPRVDSDASNPNTHAQHAHGHHHNNPNTTF